jgi:pantoate--beta-alanine ligase
MKVIEKIEIFRKERQALEGRSVGLVPTMGYLHEGHLSLVEKSRDENEITVVSIFVNPTQFGPHEDLNRYPRDFKRDAGLLQNRGVEYVFHPDEKEMYRDDHSTFVDVEKLGTVLCGKSRPGHFRGVTTVVSKLFHIVRPNRAYFGEKDAQQAVIIKRMVKDLDMDVTIRTLPIVRDSDGLALSSRNAYLSAEDRRASLALPGALKKAREMIGKGLDSAAEIKKIIRQELEKNQMIGIEYVEVVDIVHLQPVDEIEPDNTLVAAAIRVGKTRLIDNFILGEI